MRRREALRLRAKADTEVTVAIAPPPPPEKRTPPGICPRCGSFVGRSLRRHTLMCDGKFSARPAGGPPDHATQLVQSIAARPDVMIAPGNR